MIRFLLGACALVYVGLGAACLIDPVGLLAPIGVAPVDARGVVELRAMYGGLELAMGLFLASCLRDPARARWGLQAATATVAGLGTARLGGWLVARPEGSLLPTLILVELVGAALGIVALTRSRPGQPSGERTSTSA